MRTSRLLAALAGGAARRPALVLSLAALLGIGGALLALRLQPSAATSSFVSSSSAPYRSTQTFYRHFGEEPVEVLVHGDLQQLVLGLGPRPPARPRGLPVRARAGVRAGRRGGRERPVRAAREARHGQGRVRPGHVPERGGRPDPGQAHGAEQERRRRAASRRSRRSNAPPAPRGLSEAEARQLGSEAQKVTSAGYRSQLVSLALAYGLTSPPSLQNKEFISDVVFDSSKPAGHAEAALRLPVPEPQQRADLGAHAPGPLPAAARPHDRRHSRGGGDAAVEARDAGRRLPGDRRAGDRHRPREVDLERDRAAADRRRCS